MVTSPEPYSELFRLVFGNVNIQVGLGDAGTATVVPRQFVEPSREPTAHIGIGDPIRDAILPKGGDTL